MSDVLARIRVKETHGIRRFLYPLMAKIRLPQEYWKRTSLISLITSEGNAIPVQTSQMPYSSDLHDFEAHFAVSLAPHAVQEMTLTSDGLQKALGDPLQVTTRLDRGSLRTTQQRFSAVLDHDAMISEVIYDGVSHLSAPLRITRNGEQPRVSGYNHHSGDWATINAYVLQEVQYARQAKEDARQASWTRTDLTACKSWAHVTHLLNQPKDGDEVVFTLPINVTSPARTSDFGVGGGIYAKLPANEDVVLDVAFDNPPFGHWTVATGTRTDQQGDIIPSDSTIGSYGWRSWNWFHVIDSDKALAVAITQIPPYCRRMLVTLGYGGDIRIAFTLGDRLKYVMSNKLEKLLKPAEPATFGVCYHFLNDVPAIAAATNPQSILLPPTVEVLPA